MGRNHLFCVGGDRYNWSMTSTLESWMAGYRAAWESNDPQQISALFTEDAEYRTEPYAAPWVGHDGIVTGWLDHRDEPGAATFDWSPLVESAELNIVEGTTVYLGRDTVYSNLWVIRLAEDGRAHHFTEWWMRQGAE